MDEALVSEWNCLFATSITLFLNRQKCTTGFERVKRPLPENLASSKIGCEFLSYSSSYHSIVKLDERAVMHQDSDKRQQYRDGGSKTGT